MLIEVLIVAQSPGDQTKILETLAEVAPKGHRFGVRLDEKLGHYLLLGDSEEELYDLIGRAKDTTDLKFDVGAPQVAYRETLIHSVVITHIHRKQVNSAGEFSGVTIEFDPLPRGFGFVFESKTSPVTLTDASDAIAAIEQGINMEKQAGLLAGYPVTDFKATLLDCKYHEVDSDARTFRIAARAAFRELAVKGVAMLLEPIMRVQVVTPDEFLGTTIGGLNARNGRVQSTDSEGDAQIVNALVPLASMFGYSAALRSMSQSRARYEMKFSHYEPVPKPVGDDPRFRPAMAMRSGAHLTSRF